MERDVGERGVVRWGGGRSVFGVWDVVRCAFHAPTVDAGSDSRGSGGGQLVPGRRGAGGEGLVVAEQEEPGQGGVGAERRGGDPGCGGGALRGEAAGRGEVRGDGGAVAAACGEGAQGLGDGGRGGGRVGGDDGDSAEALTEQGGGAAGVGGRFGVAGARGGEDDAASRVRGVGRLPASLGEAGVQRLDEQGVRAERGGDPGAQVGAVTAACGRSYLTWWPRPSSSGTSTASPPRPRWRPASVPVSSGSLSSMWPRRTSSPGRSSRTRSSSAVTVRSASGSRLPWATATRVGGAEVRGGCGGGGGGGVIGRRVPFRETYLSCVPSWAVTRASSCAVLSRGSDARCAADSVMDRYCRAHVAASLREGDGCFPRPHRPGGAGVRGRAGQAPPRPPPRRGIQPVGGPSGRCGRPRENPSGPGSRRGSHRAGRERGRQAPNSSRHGPRPATSTGTVRCASQSSRPSRSRSTVLASPRTDSTSRPSGR